jgi:hypothetical protein
MTAPWNEYERAPGVWVIPNALPHTMARDAHTFLSQEIHPSWWFRGVQSKEKIPDTWTNKQENIARICDEERAAARGEFAYSFLRTVANHHSTCDCSVCVILTLFATPPVMQQVSSATGIAVTSLGHSFASYFAPGDFLATHTDKDNGKIAFVWNLTMEDWKPQWGGLLHLLDASWKNVETTITPSFNSLVLFDVRGEGKPHFVSQVIPGVQAKRLAISGWFS